MQQLRQESAELKQRVNEVSSLEAAKKKAEERVDVLEAKVQYLDVMRVPVSYELASARWKT